MKRIILIRHGESEGNKDHTIYRTKPDHAIELTEFGKQQAIEVGKQLKELLNPNETNILISSTYTRALQTSFKIIAEAHECIDSVRESVLLREQEQGDSYKMDILPIERERKKIGKWYYRYPNGESAVDVYQRLLMFDYQLVAPLENKVDTLIIVAHARTIQVYLMILLGLSHIEWAELPAIANCYPIVLKHDFDSGGYRLTKPLPSNVKADEPELHELELNALRTHHEEVASQSHSD